MVNPSNSFPLMKGICSKVWLPGFCLILRHMRMCSSKPILLGGNHGKNLSDNIFEEESLWGNRVIRILTRNFIKSKILEGTKKNMLNIVNIHSWWNTWWKETAFKTHPLDLLVACSLSVLRVQGVDDEAFIANQPLVISCRYFRRFLSHRGTPSHHPFQQDFAL